LGHVVGAEGSARNMTTKMKEDIEEVKKLSADTKGQVVISMSSMEGFAGTGSLFDDMTRVMGLVNGPSYLRYAPRTAFTEERIIEMDPNVILIPVYDKSEMAWQTLYRDNPGLQTVRAVRDGRVVTMPAADLYTGNQFIGESMKDILRIVRESEKGEGTHE
jgi:ABC transporter, substrate-binding protein